MHGAGSVRSPPVLDPPEVPIPRFAWVEALDLAGSLIAIRDTEDRCVFANSALAEFHETSPVELIGRTGAELAGRIGPLFGTARRGPTGVVPTISRDVVLTDATGRDRTFDVLRRIVQDAESGVRYVIEVATEIGGRAPADARPAPTARAMPAGNATRPDDARSFVSTLAEAIGASEFRCARMPDLAFSHLDKSAEVLFGVPAQELLGDVGKFLAHAIDADGAERAEKWRRASEELRPWHEEIEILNARGESRWIDVTAHPVGGEYVGLLRDVTAEKRTEAESNDAQSALDLTLATCHVGLVDWHIDSDRLASSRRLSELLELDESHPLTTGRDLANLVHPKDKARVDAQLQSHLRGETAAFRSQYRMKTGRGRWRQMLARGRVIKRAPGGESKRYLGTLEDVTDWLETRQELARQVARAEEVTQVSRELAQNVRRLEVEIRDISQHEQERIGRDLHDNLSHEPAGLSLLLKALEPLIESQPPEVGARLRSARELAERCLARTRAFAQVLVPPDLERDGFESALRRLASNVESFYGIPVRFVAETNGSVPPLAATDLYCIAREALINAAKHSRANRIEVTLETDSTGVEVSIEDDGEGLPAIEESRGGMGLKIMSYRAGIIRASLDIGAREGGGTIVRCVLPCDFPVKVESERTV